MLTDGSLQDVKALASDGDDQETVTDRLSEGRTSTTSEHRRSETGPVVLF